MRLVWGDEVEVEEKGKGVFVINGPPAGQTFTILGRATSRHTMILNIAILYEYVYA